MSRRSVLKGRAWERECARLLEAAMGLPFRRVLEECRAGNIGDVDAPDSPLAIQVKVGSRPNPYQALREAVEAAEGSGRMPVALVRKNGAGGRPAEDLAVLRLDDFLAVLEMLFSLGGTWAIDRLLRDLRRDLEELAELEPLEP